MDNTREHAIFAPSQKEFMNIPIEFLLDSSVSVVGEFELSRLNHAANLRKELRAVTEQIIDDLAEARFARWMLDNQAALRSMIAPLNAIQESFDFVDRAAREARTHARAASSFETDAAD